MATETLIIENNTSNAAGIASFIFGLISIFFMAPIFVPLAILFGIVAIASKQIAWGIIGLVCAFFGFLTSPILMAMFAVTTILSSSPTENTKPSEPQPVQQTQPQQSAFQIQQQYIEGMKEANLIALDAVQECKNKHLSGKLKTFVETAKCSNTNVEAAYLNANYMYMDLQRLVNAKRLEISEKVDNQTLTETQGELELAEFKVRVNEMAARRDAGR